MTDRDSDHTLTRFFAAEQAGNPDRADAALREAFEVLPRRMPSAALSERGFTLGPRQVRHGRVALDLEVHFHPAQQLIKQREWEAVLADDLPQLLVCGEAGGAVFARGANILAPFRQGAAPLAR